MGAQAQITSLEELSGGPAGAAHVAEFERAMGGAGSLGGDLLSELGQIKERFSQAKQELQVELSTPGDDPNSLMQMQWSLMRITMQEELIAKTVGRMSQNVETLMKTQ
ncbi:type III secretion apparatus protein, YscI/HrpB, C-terminal domain [Pseudomonas aeruginosa]|nr:type III export protein PscI [Pseudomonas aeruginosa M18]AWF57525.1 type III secretion apparatus protein, YscI/HrpB, C-terminal domain [Pseudomonas aeruginosa]ETD47919.1 preprotein translocase I [Pseudomonas aeruginosa VRFPA07]AWF69501.1 type III secretion apparatus protein, YscI/HrpB, C-terminal domain [Pseudomonas aeruginosa]AWQ83712.1 type III secretion apparatus protein, YscI/HrpB, C-terminal domain [Pseudomonas aeruginosa]